jgi:hypothetical protein
MIPDFFRYFFLLTLFPPFILNRISSLNYIIEFRACMMGIIPLGSLPMKITGTMVIFSKGWVRYPRGAGFSG